MKKPVFSVTKKDLDITYFSGHGAGGQHRNKHKNCVRIKHRDTGVIVTGQEQRSKDQNLQQAMKRLVANKKFNTWLRLQHSKALMGEVEWKRRIDKVVDQQMMDKNLKVESFVPNKNIN